MGDQCKIYIKTERTLEKTYYKQGYAVFTSENIGDTLLEVLEHCKKAQNTVIDVKVERATLEQRFMDIVREEK